MKNLGKENLFLLRTDIITRSRLITNTTDYPEDHRILRVCIYEDSDRSNPGVVAVVCRDVMKKET